MFPYKDENPNERPAYVTIGIIVLNVAVWLLAEGMGSTGPMARAVCQYGLIPGELLRSVPVGTHVRVAPGVSCVTGTPTSRGRVGDSRAAGAGRLLRHRPAELLGRADVDVHARRVAAHHRQHVVPVGLREQHRRRHGPRPPHPLLFIVRRGGGGGPGGE